MSIKNFDQLTTLFVSQFGFSNQEAIMQAAVDNYIYSLTPVADRPALRGLNMKYLTHSLDEVSKGVETLLTKMQEGVAEFSGLEHDSIYKDYKTSYSYLSFLADKIANRDIDATAALMQYINFRRTENEYYEHLSKAVKSKDGSLLNDVTGTKCTYILKTTKNKEDISDLARGYSNSLDIVIGRYLATDILDAVSQLLKEASAETLANIRIENNGDIFYYGKPVTISII